MAGDPEPPDIHELHLQLIRLERAEADLVVRHEQISARLAQFPAEHTRAQYREISANLAAVKSRIEDLEAQLEALHRGDR